MQNNHLVQPNKLTSSRNFNPENSNLIKTSNYTFNNDYLDHSALTGRMSQLEMTTAQVSQLQKKNDELKS